ncbi:polysaccharide pyruvyl transferase family protein [Microbacterium oleivorans]|uniref:Polysaccharide pyruvyl transferase domain-containing protein n=1 Tax=Microbacterium oleivorans TaxID=273677 RepID=A0A4R5YML4_9MICO|nr:polysaccharide pyruvyl transferase family protein [Microbacterium oleivorans]TDL46288.1 hypothetical protein E2R54_07665 [Microbacterium oleivorans]
MKHSRRRQVFCTIAAQHDNLGDIVIRQRMLELVDPEICDLRISVGAMPPAYIDAFDLPAHARLYRSGLAFGASFVWSSVAGRSALLLPPGPYPLTSARAALRSWASVIMSALARAGGGASVTVGKSVRGAHRGAISAERALVRISRLYVSRDRLSAQTLGIPVDALPDLALLAPARSASFKNVVAISLRYDKPVGEDLLRSVVAWSRAQGLVPTFVTQVRRDEKQHADLAERLGAEHLSWGDRSHREQMESIEELYSRSSLVVTDRLHAALLGVIGGAVPLALRGKDEPSKIVDAFDGVLPVVTLDRNGEHRLPDRLSAGLQSAETVASAREDARHGLISLRDRVRLRLAGR